MMDQISGGYTILDQDECARQIIESQGHCTSLNICIACPFVNECFKSIEDKARFLDRESRLRKAEEFLFTKVLELELE